MKRRQIGGDAGLEQRVAGALVGSAVGAEKIGAGESVDLEVDEARGGDPSPSASEPDIRDQPSFDGDIARNEPAFDERRFDPEPH